MHIKKKHPSVNFIVASKASYVSATTGPTKIDIKETEDNSSSNADDRESTPTNLQLIDEVEPMDVNPSISTTISVPIKLEFTDKSHIDDYLLRLITKDFQPFSIVEDSAFCEYTNALNSEYILPNRKVLSQILLPEKFNELYNSTKEKIQDAVSITITTDWWISVNDQGYIAVTAHYIDSKFEMQSVLLETVLYNKKHTSANLASELQRIISEWNLEDKIMLAVSDNTANIKKAIRDDLNWDYLNCLAHTINSVLRDGLTTALPLLEKVSSIVLYFKTNNIAKANLHLYQEQNERQPKRLLQAIRTRWNSQFYMLERFYELKEDITATLTAQGNNDLPMLSEEEFDIVGELIKVLAPLESVTKLMSEENYITLSSVIIIANGIHDVYTQIQKQEFSNTKSVICDILAALVSRLGNFESNVTLLVSTFLDPRFKTVGFQTESTSDTVKTLVTNLLTKLIEKESPFCNREFTTLARSDDELSIWSSFDKKAASFELTGTNRSRALIEIQRYLEEPLLNRFENPLSWWKNNAFNYPSLSKLVRIKFGSVATSIPCKRFFSKTGQLMLDRRRSLTTNKIKEIMFIHVNS